MDWRERYEKADTPWDLGRAHPELTRRLAQGHMSAGGPSVLVPGCGSGHDALALAGAGLRVTALDIVDLLQARLEPALAEHGGRFVCGDALDYREPHDALFEHTFFCAIPRARRPDYAAMAAACVRPGGHIYAIIFPIGKEPFDEGPPFHVSTEDYVACLGDAFEKVEEGEPLRVEPRPWPHRWLVLRRR